MKIRTGFVSNSSSSSFIIAIPSHIKNSDELQNYLFPPNGEGEIKLDYYDQVLSAEDVAKRVWDDITNPAVAGDIGNATKEKIIEEMTQRYHYNAPKTVNGKVEIYTSWDGQVFDELGGSWYYDINRYCGSDKELLKKLRDKIIKDERREDKLREKKWKAEAKCPIPEVPRANDYDEKYTKEQIKAYKEYLVAVSKWRKNDKGCIKAEKDYFDNIGAKYDVENPIVRELAEKDLQNFVEDTKDCKYYVVEYSDNDGESQSIMEHGDVFRNIPHMRISHH